MAETLTDADTFTATIQMPTAGENISATDLRDKAIQPFANRTENLRPRWCHVLFGAFGGVTAGSRMNISGLGGGGSSGDFTLDTVAEDVAVTDAGVYLFQIFVADVTHSASGNPQEIGLSLYYNDGGDNFIDTISTYRYSATTSDKVCLSGLAVATLGAGDTFFMLANGGTVTTASSIGGTLLIRRIG